MKRWIALLLAVCLCLSLCACGGKDTPNSTPGSTNPSQNTENKAPEKEPASDPDTEVEEPEEPRPDEEKPAADPSPVRTLALQKQLYDLRRSEGDAMLAMAGYSTVTLWNEDAALAPLAQILEQKAAMVKRSLEDQFDNMVSVAREELDAAGEDFETYTDFMDTQVRRADTVVLSLLSDTRSDYGGIEDFRGIYGTTYDVQAGRELMLSDVVRDLTVLPELVAHELAVHTWAGDTDFLPMVTDHFDNTPEDGIRWSLDYSGVTFYFSADELDGEARTATLAFAEHPQLFEEKYAAVPDSYAVELPLDSSYFTDLDGDGDMEELQVTGFYNTVDRCYSMLGLYSETLGGIQYFEQYTESILPYYVKTAQGGHYIYLFCRSGMGPALLVFDVSGGNVTGAGRMAAEPAYLAPENYVVPTDPQQQLLDFYDGPAMYRMPCHTGADGVPVSASDDFSVRVSSVQELIEAIGPYTDIIVEPGFYNLSDYIEELWDTEGEKWNEDHPFVQLRDCYDGVELVIRQLNNLSIRGGDEGVTEIVTDPRYAQVLNFEECSCISLSNLTMGHTKTGECSGNVLDFANCHDITLRNMDLYGCGVYGISCNQNAADLYVYNSIIRDCSYGALEIYGGYGRYEFHNCTLTGSAAYDIYEPCDGSALAFYGCTFGDNETSSFMFRDDVVTVNCTWSDNYVYPEFGYDDYPTFDPDTMTGAPVDRVFLEETYWLGYALVNPESGETTMLPYVESDGTYVCVTMDLYADGTGWYEDADEVVDLTWDVWEDGTICLTLEDGRSYYASGWTMADEDYIWLLLETEEGLAWLY